VGTGDFDFDSMDADDRTSSTPARIWLTPNGKTRVAYEAWTEVAHRTVVGR
jgi:hypothetical protein